MWSGLYEFPPGIAFASPVDLGVCCCLLEVFSICSSFSVPLISVACLVACRLYMFVFSPFFSFCNSFLVPYCCGQKGYWVSFLSS